MNDRAKLKLFAIAFVVNQAIWLKMHHNSYKDYMKLLDKHLELYEVTKILIHHVDPMAAREELEVYEEFKKIVSDLRE